MSNRSVVSEAERFAADFARDAGYLVAGLGKIAGAAVGASGSFSHVGLAEEVTIQWGIAPGDNTPNVVHPERFIYLVGTYKVQVGADAARKTYPFTLSAVFPAIPADWWGGYLTGKVGSIDCYISVLRPNASVGVNKWWDDVYDITIGSEYGDLAATFT